MLIYLPLLSPSLPPSRLINGSASVCLITSLSGYLHSVLLIASLLASLLALCLISLSANLNNLLSVPPRLSFNQLPSLPSYLPTVFLSPCSILRFNLPYLPGCRCEKHAELSTPSVELPTCLSPQLPTIHLPLLALSFFLCAPFASSPPRLSSL